MRVGQFPGIHIDLNALEQQLGRRKRLVSFVSPLGEITLTLAGRQRDIILFLVPDGVQKANFAAIWLIVVADPNFGVVRQLVQNVRDRIIEVR